MTAHPVTEHTHPFLPPPAPEPETDTDPEQDPILGNNDSLPGVKDPGSALAGTLAHAPTKAVPLPVKISSRTLWLVGACGGAGVSTLVSLLDGGTVDAAVTAPVWQGRAMIVAPTHPAGLAAAHALALANAKGELLYEVLGIIWVHDRPTLSPGTVKEAQRIGRMFPRIHTLPYEAEWREPGRDIKPRQIRTKNLLRKLNKLTQVQEKK